jgi:hypothetical protein
MQLRASLPDVLTMTAADFFSTYGGWLGALVAGVAAAYERFRSTRATDKALQSTERAQEAEAGQAAHKAILAQQDELIRLARDSATQWKERCAAEHMEYTSYREKHHSQIQEANAKILRQTEEIADLKSRTDMSPVMGTLKQIVESLERILERLDNHHPKE